jgi:hypothetical protein
MTASLLTGKLIMLSDRFLFVIAALVTMALWTAWDRRRVARARYSRPVAWFPWVIGAIVVFALLLVTARAYLHWLEVKRYHEATWYWWMGRQGPISWAISTRPMWVLCVPRPVLWTQGCC